MGETAVQVLALLSCIGAGIVSGVFFAFSTFIMKALAQLPAQQGIAAMQRINVVVLNPLFLSVFLGTAVLAGACIVVSLIPVGAERAFLLVPAALVYLFGSFAVTVASNIPRNDKLNTFAADSEEASAYWPVYVREWSRWNHVRGLAALISSALAALAIG